ncbi:MAG: hypothetical protein DCF19_07415 [Pseudanabaena frigida]|uniref:Uncharacterized protein n=1 Tax=Pseudanabaena frigida TaxID=945775 RepID=A0A2W4WKJ2_9CYAN|nr:MAG: hypothetical protein DCF19_07415 [Pseudanabaena frigida]
MGLSQLFIEEDVAIDSTGVHSDRMNLQHFASNPKPRKSLKALQSNAFKLFLVVRLIGNCCKAV